MGDPDTPANPPRYALPLAAASALLGALVLTTTLVVVPEGYREGVTMSWGVVAWNGFWTAVCVLALLYATRVFLRSRHPAGRDSAPLLARALPLFALLGLVGSGFTSNYFLQRIDLSTRLMDARSCSTVESGRSMPTEHCRNSARACRLESRWTPFSAKSAKEVEVAPEIEMPTDPQGRARILCLLDRLAKQPKPPALKLELPPGLELPRIAGSYDPPTDRPVVYVTRDAVLFEGKTVLQLEQGAVPEGEGFFGAIPSLEASTKSSEFGSFVIAADRRVPARTVMRVMMSARLHPHVAGSGYVVGQPGSDGRPVALRVSRFAMSEGPGGLTVEVFEDGMGVGESEVDGVQNLAAGDLARLAELAAETQTRSEDALLPSLKPYDSVDLQSFLEITDVARGCEGEGECRIGGAAWNRKGHNQLYEYKGFEAARYANSVLALSTEVLGGAADSVRPDRYASRLESDLPRAYWCYQEALARNPSASGTVTLRYDVNPEGTVTRAQVESMTFDDPAMRTCLIRMARGWEFNHRVETEIEVRSRLEFGAGREASSQ